MKLMKRMTVIGLGLLMFGCQSDDAGDSATPVDVSGSVRGGYRIIDLAVSGDPATLTVYRGDYIKFMLDDGDDPQAQYQLDIPALDISTILMDNSEVQPYFKMKKTGTYDFSIGERVGQITVVDLKQSNYRELTSEEAWQMLRKNPPLLLDVRTKEEFGRGYIKDARLIPLQEIQARAGELEQYKNQPILIYCATGNRSTTAAKILLDKGFKNVMNMRNGIVGWASKGYDVQFR